MKWADMLDACSVGLRCSPISPPLPPFTEQVDPEIRLACSFDQQASCVAEALMAVPMWKSREPYSIDLHPAGRPIVWAAWKPPHWQFVVWHANQVVKTIPIKGLMGREMSI